MKKIFFPGIIIFCFLLFLTIACRKGEFVKTQQYMKLSVEAFFPDTALYTSIQLDDSVLRTHTEIIPGGATTILPSAELERPSGDSMQLKLTIVKKNFPTINLDSTVFITNNNAYLLFQLDPNKPARLINKFTENATAIQPTADSIKVRFFFSSAANIRNPSNGNSAVTRMDMQFYMYAQGVIETGPKYRVYGDQLTDYFSFARNKNYAFTLLDVSPGVASNKRLIQAYEFDPNYDDFIQGKVNLPGNPDGKFLTMNISTQFNIYTFLENLESVFLFALN